MKILVLTHYFPPEVNAPASRTFENARVWAAQGHEVTVVTCAPNHPAGKLYPGYRNRLFQRERRDGVDVVRVWTFLAANEGFALRLLNFLSYPLSVLAQAWRLPRADVVMSTSPQFFCGLAGWWFRRRGTPWVLEIRDLWPESVVAVGVAKRSLAIRFFEKIERWAYRTADLVVAVTDAFAPHIAAARGSAPIEVVKNGVDLDFYDLDKAAPAGEALRRELGLEGKFVAAYVGTHGMAHGLGTILDAAELLRDRQDILFLLVGDGAQRAGLIEEAERRGLANVRLIGQRPKSDMPGIWALTDASLVVLRRSDTFKSVLPSKMFEAMGMRRPMILGVEGEARALLEAAGAGIPIAPENPAELADAVRTLADDPARARAMGESGRRYAALHYDRRRLAKRYLGALEAAIAAKRVR